MQFLIRSMTHRDLDIANSIIQAAYHTSRDYHEVLHRYLLWQPDGWWLAWHKQKDLPIGMIGSMNYGPFAWIGLLGVLPDEQRRGIGMILMQHVLEKLQYLSCPTVLLDATEAGIPLYRRCGFTIDDRVYHFQHFCTDQPLPDLLYHPEQTYIQITPFQLSDLTALTNFDAHYFGAGRAPIFATLYQKNAQSFFIARDDQNTITGFIYLSDNNVLGPWVASTGAIAEALLRHVLTLPHPQKLAVFTPFVNSAAQQLLPYYGFTLQRILFHMRRGPHPFIRQREHIYGQTSLALG